MEDIKYVIIPDVHGRGFWKEAVEKYKGTGCRFIFLGDYMDPYPYEKIKDEDNYGGAAEIMRLKEENPDMFILLCGNHDLHYIDPELRASRYDWNNGIRNRALMKGNLHNMQLVHTCELGGRKFLFSHAGVNAEWCRMHADILGDAVSFDADGIFDAAYFGKLEKLNNLLTEEDGETRKKIFSALAECSFWRGGDGDCGSLVWSDYHEYIDESSDMDGVVQIFGHSQQADGPACIEDRIYCLDCRRYFLLDNSGHVLQHDGTPVTGHTVEELVNSDSFYPSSLSRNK